MTEFNVGFDEAGIQIEHHMPVPEIGDETYIKRVDIPAGKVLANHTHTFTHKSILASGRIILTVGDAEPRTLEGPVVLTVRQGHQHMVEAVTDAVWFCIHSSIETDPDRIDHTLVKGD